MGEGLRKSVCQETDKGSEPEASLPGSWRAVGDRPQQGLSVTPPLAQAGASVMAEQLGSGLALEPGLPKW